MSAILLIYYFLFILIFKVHRVIIASILVDHHLSSGKRSPSSPLQLQLLYIRSLYPKAVKGHTVVGSDLTD